MTTRTASILKGLDYQHLYSWHLILKLLDDDGAQMAHVAVEDASSAPADDVTIVRRPGSPLPSEFWQVKFHVDHRGSYSHTSLACLPRRASSSQLQKLLQAWRALSGHRHERVVGLVSNWTFDSRDALKDFVSSEHALVPGLVTPSSRKARVIAECWRTHLKCRPSDFRAFLRALRLRMGYAPEGELRQLLRYQMNSRGLPGDARALAVAMGIVRDWIKNGRSRITRLELRRALERYGLTPEPRPIAVRKAVGEEAARRISGAVHGARALTATIPRGQAASLAAGDAVDQVERRLKRLLERGRPREVLKALVRRAKQWKRTSDQRRRYILAAYWGLALLRMDRYPEALVALRKAQRLAPQRAQSATNVAVVYMKLENARDAEPWAQRAVALDAMNATGLEILARIAAGRGHHEGARRYARCVPRGAHRSLLLADLADSRGKKGLQLRLLRSLVKKSKDPQAMVRLAHALIQLDDAPDAARVVTPWARATADERKAADEAMRLLSAVSQIYEARRSEDELAHCLIQRGVIRAYSRGERADEEFVRAVQLAPDNPVVARRAIQYWLQEGEGDNALRLLTVQAHAAGDLKGFEALHARALFLAGRTSELLTALRRRAYKAALSAEERGALLGLAFAREREFDKALAAIAGLGEDGAHAQMAVARARILVGKGDPRAAIDVLAAALPSVPSTERWKVAVILAETHAQQGEWAKAIEVYRTVIAPAAMPAIVGDYLRCLFNGDRLGDCVAFGREVEAAQGLKSEFGIILAKAFAVLGHLTEAEQMYRRLAALNPADAEPMVELAGVQYRRGVHKDARRLIPRPEEAAALRHSIAERAAEIMLVSGNVAAAVKTAFLFFQRHIDDPEAHLLFAKMMFWADGRDRALFNPDVAKEATVLDLDWQGRRVSMEIVPSGGRVLGPNQRLPESLLAQGLLGHRVGDRIAVSDSGMTGEATILGIRSLYGVAYGDVMDHFGERFPGRDEIEKVQLDGAGLARVRASVEYMGRMQGQVRRLYENELPPIDAIAHAIRRSTVETWYLLVFQNFSERVVISAAVPDEATQLAATAEGAHSVVLELTALLALAEYGVLSELAGAGMTCVVAQATVDALAEAVTERLSASVRTMGTMRPVGDGIAVHMVSMRQGRRALRMFESLLAWTRRTCEVRGAPLSRANGRSGALDVLATASVDSILLAREPGMVLVTDDFGLRRWASEHGGVAATTSLGLLDAAQRRGRLEVDKLEEARAMAVCLRYEPVTVRSGTVRAAVRLDKGVVGFTTGLVVERLSEARMPDESLLECASDVLSWGEGHLAARQLEILCGRLNRAIVARHRGEDLWQRVGATIRRRCERNGPVGRLLDARPG